MIQIPGLRYANISNDVKLGRSVKIFEFVNLYGCEIKDEAQIGAFVEIQKDAVIGKRSRIQSHSFICSGVQIGDDVFVGHNVTFINDRYPTAKKAREKKWKLEKTLVQKGVTIGSGVTILCGVMIGEGALIGAGSVVVGDVPAYSVVAGNPAKLIRKIKK